MRYLPDHDLHHHSVISPCAHGDTRQIPEAMLAAALADGLSLICLTDHTWDPAVDCPCHNTWLDRPVPVSPEKLRENLPLPQSEQCAFVMGCEVDMNRFGTLGISREEMDKFDFIILSVSHLNLKNFTIDPAQIGSDALSRKEYYKARLLALLDTDLPFSKMGLAHFTVANACREDPFGCIAAFSDAELHEIFKKAADRGIGVELNFRPVRYDDAQLKTVLRPYRIAKEEGCKFYFGGDAHHPEGFCGRRAAFEQIIDLLGLEESDKFPLVPALLEKARRAREAAKEEKA